MPAGAGPASSASTRTGTPRELFAADREDADGASWTSPPYSVVDAEWPAVGAGLRAWLAPETFDERGRQRAPLRRS